MRPMDEVGGGVGNTASFMAAIPQGVAARR